MLKLVVFTIAMSNFERFRILSVEDIYLKLKHYSDTNKNELLQLINNHMAQHRIKNPIIRIHNEEISNLFVDTSNSQGLRLASHHADIFVIDYPEETLQDPIFFNKLIKIVLPRLTQDGLLVFSTHSGIRKLKKNVSYGLRDQLVNMSA